MIELFDALARTGNRPMLVRSLFLWHQILGPGCAAEPRLRRMAGVIIGLPPGADIAEQHIAVRPIPDGFDIQENGIPGADVLFAYFSESGLRLSMSSEKRPDGRLSRRLRLCRTDGTLFQRQGPERVMLRYRLDPAILRARDIVVLQLTQQAGQSPAALPPLNPWIEIHSGAARTFVETAEASAGMLADGEAIRLAAFAPGALTQAAAGMVGQAGLYFYLELTGDLIDVTLLGETLIA